MNVAVLYEDSRGPDQDFPFHRLVVRSFADGEGVPDEDVWRLARRIRGIPRKGNGNLLADLRNPTWLGQVLNAHRVVAVFDRDKVGELVGTASADCRATVVAALSRDIALAGAVKVVLIEQNLETVLAAIHAAGSDLASDSVFREAFGKRRQARDVVFAKAAARRDVREAVCRSVSSFAYLVGRVAERLR